MTLCRTCRTRDDCRGACTSLTCGCFTCGADVRKMNYEIRKMKQEEGDDSLTEDNFVLCAWCQQEVPTVMGSTGYAQQRYKKNHDNKQGKPCLGGQTPAYGRPMP